MCGKDKLGSAYNGVRGLDMCPDVMTKKTGYVS